MSHSEPGRPEPEPGSADAPGERDWDTTLYGTAAPLSTGELAHRSPSFGASSTIQVVSENAWTPLSQKELDDIYRAIDADIGPTSTALDRLWGRILAMRQYRSWWNWGGPILVTLLALILRVWNLGHPQALIFDETYYVKDAWTLVHNGYEASWPDGSDTDQLFASGHVNIYTKAAEFVAHPPLGKWIIGLGELGIQALGKLFNLGPNWGESVGWRISTALMGTLAVVLVMFIAKKLFKSTFVTVLAGFLMAIEGNAIVMSRVALLDNSVMFFALLGFTFVLLDRDQNERRMHRWAIQNAWAGWPSRTGPLFWKRPWLLAAGLTLGLDTGVKWSGVYFLAVFCIYVVMTDMMLRRRLYLPRPVIGAWIKQGWATFLLTVPIAFVGYLLTWTGWIVTKGGWDRTGQGNWILGLWDYTRQMYNYSINLHVGHPYQSNPWSWPIMLRPTSMYWQSSGVGQNGCTAVGGCTQAITDLANPLIWWAASAALIYMIYLFAFKRDWIAGILLMAFGAGWLPWCLLYSDRTIFTFYSIAFEPYMILALAYALWKIAGHAHDPRYRRRRGLWTVGIFLFLSVLLTGFFFPIWTAEQIPYWYWRAHMWFQIWI